MAQWYELVGAGVGGGAITAVANFLRTRSVLAFNRETKLWEEIGALKSDIKTMQDEIKLLRQDRHDLKNKLNDEKLVNMALRMEINDILKSSGKQPKYPVEVVMRAQHEDEGNKQ